MIDRVRVSYKKADSTAISLPYMVQVGPAVS
jgi:hypothetical protein